MKDTPFYNYCDYWCEKCDHTDQCQVYQKELDRSLKHLTEGKDPANMEVVIEDVQESLKELMELLQKEAQKLGIDLDEPLPELKAPPEPFTFPLYRLAYEFTKNSHKLLEHLREKDLLLINRAEKEIRELSWYHTLVSVKLARALSSK